MGMRTVEPNGWTLASDVEDDWLSWWLKIPIGNNGWILEKLKTKDRYIFQLFEEGVWNENS